MQLCSRSSLLLSVLLVGLLLPAAVVCVCPTNGDARVLYVTANGDRTGFHDILMLDTTGRPVGTAINWTSVPSHVVMKKLRGMAFGPDGRLYVAAALGRFSKIVAFKAHLEQDCTRRFDAVVAAIGRSQRYMKHPYTVLPLPVNVSAHVTPLLAAGSGNNKKHQAAPFALMTTNQNTVSVSWMNGLDGTPLPSPKYTVSQALAAVESADDNTTMLQRAARQSSMGVFAIHDAWSSGGAHHDHEAFPLRSVRGAALHPNGKWLLVADVDSDAVCVFDLRTGRRLWAIPVPAPIQIAFAPEGFFSLDGRHAAASIAAHVLVTTKTSSVFVVPVVDPSDDRTIAALVADMRLSDPVFQREVDQYHKYNPPPSPAERRAARAPRVFIDGDFSATSGIAFDAAAGIVYIADRVERQIFRVRFDGVLIGRFGPALSDQPEHLLPVTIATPEELPHCYELGAAGLKYSVICVAAWCWLALAVFGAAMLLAARRWYRQGAFEDAAGVKK